MTQGLWTALPAQALRHVATAQVESFEHYVLRMSEVTGLRRASLLKPTQIEAVPAAIPRRWLLQHVERAIGVMEHLTGQTDLRCGTLWAVSRALSLHGMCAMNRPRRWCPVCYAEQEMAEASEPLAWSIRLLQTCPAHRCALVDRCRICGATQLDCDASVQRRQCRQCAASLGWRAGSAHLAQSPLERWIDAQILAIVRYAADPQSAQLPSDAFHRACSVLRCIPERWARVPASVRSRLRTHTQRMLPPPVLEVLLEVSATQHCGVMALLTAPEAIIQTSLWPNATDAQDAGLRRPAIPLLRLRALLDHLLDEVPAAYLPPLASILPRLGMELAQARQAEPGRVARYQQRYVRQGTSARLRRLDIAVTQTLHSSALTSSLVPTPAQRAQLRQRLARHLAAEDAAKVCTTAMALSHLPVRG
ncbi:MAG: TniQ family protein [Vulcanimicrobiaceae bacterium]